MVARLKVPERDVSSRRQQLVREPGHCEHSTFRGASGHILHGAQASGSRVAEDLSIHQRWHVRPFWPMRFIHEPTGRRLSGWTALAATRRMQRLGRRCFISAQRSASVHAERPLASTSGPVLISLPVRFVRPCSAAAGATLTPPRSSMPNYVVNLPSISVNFKFSL